jgi:hypothetical protein
MSEFHLSEFYLRQHQAEIARHAEGHHITDRIMQKRRLAIPTGLARFRLWRRRTLTLSRLTPSLSHVSETVSGTLWRRKPNLGSEGVTHIEFY